MPTFLYEAIDSEGKMVKGTIDAENQRVVINKLREMRYTVKSITERSSSNVQTDLLAYVDRFRRVNQQSLTIFSRQFATMINAGLAMVRCLDILSQQTEDKKLQEVLIAVRKDVEGGSTLSNALGKYPHVFSTLYISMVKAGEMGGVLDTVLNRLANFLEADLKLAKKVKSAMTYPVVILIMALAIVFFLVTYILPTFVDLFEGMDLALPLPTKILIGVTKGARNPLVVGPVILLVIVLVVVFNQYVKTQAGRMQYDMLKLRVPIFGMLNKKVAISRFCRTLGT
ncbi:MAG: type II secretion system F family protein, partial [Candidatus Eremiobacterota bacterium]